MDNSRPQYSPYIEISQANLLHNVAAIRSRLPSNVAIAAVVKDFSYGCGDAVIAKALETQAGINFFVVARPCEAAGLRNSGINGTILVLGMATEDELRFGAENNIVFALNDICEIDRFASVGAKIRAHINIDTGMSRMGILPAETDELIAKIKNSTANIFIEGIFTHMACADEPDTTSVDAQLKIFKDALRAFRVAGINPKHIHYGNSATLLRFPIDECTLARPGIALYGCKPDPRQEFGVKLLPVAALKSSVVKIKTVSANTKVSYSWNYTTKSQTQIATVALGYAHGLPRYLSGKGSVLIGGKRYPIAGNVTMDYIMVDIGANSNIKVGDEVVAIGTQGTETITPDDIATLGNTIAYEVLCNTSQRLKRILIV